MAGHSAHGSQAACAVPGYAVFLLVDDQKQPSAPAWGAVPSKPMLGQWNIVDVTDWSPDLEETRGLRPKRWIIDPDGGSWLRKSPRTRSPFEPAIECLALRLAAASGLDAAYARPCKWTDPEDGSGQRGIVVRLFVGDPEELHGGDRLLAGGTYDYDPENRALHTLDRVRDVLKAREPSPGVLLEPFARMLAFDGLIGNSDRHQGNWSLITGAPTGVRLAPMYDPAGCLGAELDDQHKMLTSNPSPERLQRYVVGCPSGFGDGTRLIKLEAALDQARSWPEWPEAVAYVLEGFERARPHVRTYLDSVPDEWYPQNRRGLGLALLDARCKWMRGFL